MIERVTQDLFDGRSFGLSVVLMLGDVETSGFFDILLTGRWCLREDSLLPYLIGDELAKPNYSYEKRQRDLAKKKKQEEKKQRKLVKGPDSSDENQEGTAEAVEG
jgi:hypothetical protein